MTTPNRPAPRRTAMPPQREAEPLRAGTAAEARDVQRRQHERTGIAAAKSKRPTKGA